VCRQRQGGQGDLRKNPRERLSPGSATLESRTCSASPGPNQRLRGPARVKETCLDGILGVVHVVRLPSDDDAAHCGRPL
jgi:hypothetical protein